LGTVSVLSTIEALGAAHPVGARCAAMIAARALPALLSAAVLAAVGAVACDVGDALCPYDTVDEDRADTCPYGPPGGPQKKKAEQCVIDFDDTDCTVTWADDVYPRLVAPLDQERSGGGCTNPGCHGDGSQGGAKILLPDTATPPELYELLAAYANDRGDPYVAEGDANAWFLCNLKAIEGGGSAMPPTAGLTDLPASEQDDDDLAVIEKWVACGMKNDGLGAGGGGAGGAGGGS
jgi:hypothetical protein